MSSREEYVTLLATVSGTPLLIRYDTLGDRLESLPINWLQGDQQCDLAYSEKHDILVISCVHSNVGVELGSMTPIWRSENSGGGSRVIGNVLIVPNEKGDGEDAVYVGVGTIVHRINILNGQVISSVNSNVVNSLSYFGTPGWVVATTTNEKGFESISIMNPDLKMVKDRVLISESAKCSVPTTQQLLISGKRETTIGVICSKDSEDRRVLYALKAFASDSSILNSIRFTTSVQVFGLTLLSGDIFVSKQASQIVELSFKGGVTKSIKSTNGDGYCLMVSSVNGMIYSICRSNVLSLTMEAVAQ